MFTLIVEQMRFECGYEPYKALENMLFAGSLRFAKEETGVYAVINLARVLPGSGFE